MLSSGNKWMKLSEKAKNGICSPFGGQMMAFGIGISKTVRYITPPVGQKSFYITKKRSTTIRKNGSVEFILKILIT